METTVAQPEAAPTETAPVEAAPVVTEADPFAVDESQFVSLSPEQRAALDPVMTKWKESAKGWAEKQWESKKKEFEPHIRESQALRKLISDPKFTEWYNKTYVNPQTGDKTAAPKTVASSAEWVEAYQALSQGDPAPLEALQAKLVMSVGGPELQKTQQEMNVLRAENEMNKLFAGHPDAKDLDMIGREDNPENPSLLQLCLQVVKDQRGGTMEQAYQMAARVAKSMENKGKRAAVGIVDGKKAAVTDTTKKPISDEGVQTVDTFQEALEANIKAELDGRKVKYVVKK